MVETALSLCKTTQLLQRREDVKSSKDRYAILKPRIEEALEKIEENQHETFVLLDEEMLEDHRSELSRLRQEFEERHKTKKCTLILRRVDKLMKKDLEELETRIDVINGATKSIADMVNLLKDRSRENELKVLRVVDFLDHLDWDLEKAQNFQAQGGIPTLNDVLRHYENLECRYVGYIVEIMNTVYCYNGDCSIRAQVGDTPDATPGQVQSTVSVIIASAGDETQRVAATVDLIGLSANTRSAELPDHEEAIAPLVTMLSSGTAVEKTVAAAAL